MTNDERINHAIELILDVARSVIRREMTEAISAAVQTERARCIEIAINGFFDITGTYNMTPPEIIKHTRRGIAASISARSAQEERTS